MPPERRTWRRRTTAAVAQPRPNQHDQISCSIATEPDTFRHHASRGPAESSAGYGPAGITPGIDRQDHPVSRGLRASRPRRWVPATHHAAGSPVHIRREHASTRGTCPRCRPQSPPCRAWLASRVPAARVPCGRFLSSSPQLPGRRIMAILSARVSHIHAPKSRGLFLRFVPSRPALRRMPPSCRKLAPCVE